LTGAPHAATLAQKVVPGRSDSPATSHATAGPWLQVARVVRQWLKTPLSKKLSSILGANGLARTVSTSALRSPYIDDGWADFVTASEAPTEPRHRDAREGGEGFDASPFQDPLAVLSPFGSVGMRSVCVDADSPLEGSATIGTLSGDRLPTQKGVALDSGGRQVVHVSPSSISTIRRREVQSIPIEDRTTALPQRSRMFLEHVMRSPHPGVTAPHS